MFIKTTTLAVSLFFVIFLSSCVASNGEYVRRLDKLIGENIVNVDSRLVGSHVSTRVSPNGNTVHVYVKDRSFTSPAVSRTEGSYTGNQFTGWKLNSTTTTQPEVYVEKICRTLLEVNDYNQIVAWNWDGDCAIHF